MHAGCISRIKFGNNERRKQLDTHAKAITKHIHHHLKSHPRGWFFFYSPLLLYLCARFGLIPSQRTMETTYEFILRLKHTQCWEGCKCLFPQASTLERYYRGDTGAVLKEKKKQKKKNK